MNSQLDTNLALIYKNMVGLNNIKNDIGGNTDLILSLSINPKLYISNNSTLNNSTSINSTLKSLKNLFSYGSSSVNSYLNISGITILNGSSSINSKLNINNFNNNNLNINGYNNISNIVTCNSSINISGTALFNSINVNNISSNSLFNIYSSNINIGTTNSNIFINGTATYIASIQSLMIDKLISLNVNSTKLQASDIGSLSGIEIMGISSSGFIMTASDASRYQIKLPLYNSLTNYITVQNLNNNLIISGTTSLLNNTTILSTLNISSASIMNNSTSINSSLNISNSTLINSSCSINNSLYISNTTILNNTCSFKSSLSINGFINIENTTSINSSLNINGSSIINGQLNINRLLNVNGITNLNNYTTIYNSLNISSYTIINGFISANNSINISGLSNILGNKTINSNLCISGITLLNNSTTLNSSLYVNKNTLINNYITINSNLGIFGQIMTPLQNFNYNTDAKNAGIPIWGFYRTGGALKIRLNDIPPIINISGGTTLSINIGSTYNDPGAYSLDFQNLSNSVYLSSISNNSGSILTNILVSGYSTLITQSSILTIGSYTATYTATDSCGNLGYNYRLLNILNLQTATAYNLTNGWLGKEIYNFTSYINNNNFTIETWIYLTSFTSNYMTIVDFRDPSNWTSNLGIQQNTDGSTGKCLFGMGPLGLFVWCNTSTYYFMTTGTIQLNTWNHIVWMRYNNNLYGFINGYNDNGGITVSSAGGSALNNLTNLQTIIIGRDASQINMQFNGYLSQVLIRSGAQYNINGFIPFSDLSTIPTTNNLFFLNNNNTDTTNNYILPINGTVPTIDRYFNYILSYDCTLGFIGAINPPSYSNWNTIFNNDFTFETWLYPTQYNSQLYSVILDTQIIGYSSNLPNIIKLVMCQNGTIGFTWSNNIISISTDSLALNQWSHVVWMRYNNNLYVYINGYSYSGYNLTSNNIIINNLQVISFCHSVDRSTSDISFSFQGQISQPLFTNHAKYNIITNFIPQNDMTPLINDSTIIFYVGNNLLLTSNASNLSNQTLTRYGSVYNTFRNI